MDKNRQQSSDFQSIDKGNSKNLCRNFFELISDIPLTRGDV